MKIRYLLLALLLSQAVNLFGQYLGADAGARKEIKAVVSTQLTDSLPDVSTDYLGQVIVTAERVVLPKREAGSSVRLLNGRLLSTSDAADEQDRLIPR